MDRRAWNYNNDGSTMTISDVAEGRQRLGLRPRPRWNPVWLRVLRSPTSLRSAVDSSGSLREPSQPTRQTGFRQIWQLATDKTCLIESCWGSSPEVMGSGAEPQRGLGRSPIHQRPPAPFLATQLTMAPCNYVRCTRKCSGVTGVCRTGAPTP